jgi:hypothetical protein
MHSEKPETISLSYGMASHSLQLKDMTKTDDVVKNIELCKIWVEMSVNVAS